MENIVFIVFLLFVLIAMLVLAFAIWVAATEIFSDNFGDTDANELKENKEGSEVRFPYTELIGLTKEDYERKYGVKYDVHFPLDDRSSYMIDRECYGKTIITGVKFCIDYNKEFSYDYKKYYNILEEFAKARNIKIVSKVIYPRIITDNWYLIYEVVDFNCSNEDSGLEKWNDHTRFEEFCESKLQKQLNDITFLNDVERFNNKKS